MLTDSSEVLIRLGFPSALTVSKPWAGVYIHNSDTSRILFKNKYANTSDTTLPSKRSGHGVYVVVHTLVSKCKVGQR